MYLCCVEAPVEEDLVTELPPKGPTPSASPYRPILPELASPDLHELPIKLGDLENSPYSAHVDRSEAVSSVLLPILEDRADSQQVAPEVASIILTSRSKTLGSLFAQAPKTSDKAGRTSFASGDSGQKVGELSSAVSSGTLSRLPTEFDPSHGLRSSLEVGQNDSDWGESYEVKVLLGKGGFGTVQLVVRKKDKKKLAMKIVEAHKLSDRHRFQQEFDVSRQMKHPNIIGFHELLQGQNQICLIMDLCTGGDLFNMVIETQAFLAGRMYGGLQTSQVTRYAWQMLSGLAYLHHYRFAHRDVKLENYMLATNSETSEVKLIDFGLARRFHKGAPMKSQVGTPHYCAPEVYEGTGYSELCDVWSLGVCMYVMGTASFPFGGKDQHEVLQNVKKDTHNFNDVNWTKHPKNLTKIIDMMMTKDPAQRVAAKVVLEDRWLRSKASGESCCVIS